MNQNDLKSRTKEFALWIMKLSTELSDNNVGRAIASQLIKQELIASLLTEANELTAIIVQTDKISKNV